MRALITGAGGQLATELVKTAPAGWTVLARSRAELDLADVAAVEAAVARERPDLVLNAAAYTAVDRSESEPEAAFAANRDGPAALARAARAIGARLAHVSTDFVFGGDAGRPYGPGDATAPLGTYGESKRAGEEAVLTALPDALIVRTAWVYAAHGANFLKTMLRLMGSREEVRVVADQVGAPTAARDLAQAVWALAIAGEGGVLHFTNAGVASWYDFAQAIEEEARAAGQLERPCRVVPIRTVDYPTPARRPSYSVLDCTATWARLGAPARHWRAALRETIAESAPPP